MPRDLSVLGIAALVLATQVAVVVAHPGRHLSSAGTVEPDVMATNAAPSHRPPIDTRHLTEPGAAAFAAAYLQRVNYAFSAPDPEALDGLALPGCTGCTAWRREAQRLRTERLHVDGSTLVATAPRLRQIDDGSAVLDVEVDQRRIALRSPHGGAAGWTTPRTEELELRLQRGPGGWQVASVGRY